jgi:hypothetical protein
VHKAAGVRVLSYSGSGIETTFTQGEDACLAALVPQMARNDAPQLLVVGALAEVVEDQFSRIFGAMGLTNVAFLPPRRASEMPSVGSGTTMLLAQPFLADNRVRLIGYCGTDRHAQFRDLPTLREQGVKGYDYSSWVALFLHKDVPPDVLAVLRREAQAISEDKDFQQQLIRSGLEPWPRTAAQLGPLVEGDFQRWKKIIQDANIQGT